MKHFYFVILFIAFLFHNLCVAGGAGAAAGAEDYCQILERQIVRSCGKDIAARTELSDGLLDAVVRGAALAAPAAVDWRGDTLGNMVSNLLSIQKVKLDKRSVATAVSPYKTGYSKTGIGVDPYPLTIRLTGSMQKLILNYNGSLYTNQPGNCFLKDATTGASLAYDVGTTLADFQDPSRQILMAVEIVRRKAVDPHRADGVDEHANIPVAVGIMMATKLAQDGAIAINDFWKKDGAYHIFSNGNVTRMANFKALLATYEATYGTLVPSIAEAHAAAVYGFDLPPPPDLTWLFGGLEI